MLTSRDSASGAAAGSGGDNPFHDAATRHVIGATSGIDPDHLATTLRYLTSGLRLALSTLLPSPTMHCVCTVATWPDYTALPTTIMQTFTAAGLRPDACAELVQAALELTANAIYDAPVEGGRHLFASTARTVPVPIIRPVEVELASDGRTAAVAVRDRFGSLSASANRGEPLPLLPGERRNQIHRKPGGAGLGLFMALAGSSRLIFNIVPGETAEAILARRHDQRRGIFQATTPTLNICVAGDRADRRRAKRHSTQLAAVLDVGVCRYRRLCSTPTPMAPWSRCSWRSEWSPRRRCG